jgi:hypothetical protein
MRKLQRVMALVGLLGLTQLGALAVPGCSDEQTKTGTLVERTPEQEATEKASMEGMRKAMMKLQGQQKQQ